MDLNKVKNIYKDFAKSGFQFGRTISNYLMNRLEASPETAKFGGTMLDLAGGAGITYLGAAQMVGIVVNTGFALAAITTAPVSAVVTVAVGAVFSLLSTGLLGIGIGMLDAGREKCGLPDPFANTKGTVAAAKDKYYELSDSFTLSRRKLAASFKQAVTGKKQTPTTTVKPNANNNFDF